MTIYKTDLGAINATQLMSLNQRYTNKIRLSVQPEMSQTIQEVALPKPAHTVHLADFSQPELPKTVRGSKLSIVDTYDNQPVMNDAHQGKSNGLNGLGWLVSAPFGGLLGMVMFGSIKGAGKATLQSVLSQKAARDAGEFGVAKTFKVSRANTVHAPGQPVRVPSSTTETFFVANARQARHLKHDLETQITFERTNLEAARRALDDLLTLKRPSPASLALFKKSADNVNDLETLIATYTQNIRSAQAAVRALKKEFKID